MISHAPGANNTIKRRGRKGRKEKMVFLRGLRGLCVPRWRQFVGRAPRAVLRGDCMDDASDTTRPRRQPVRSGAAVSHDPHGAFRHLFPSGRRAARPAAWRACRRNMDGVTAAARRAAAAADPRRARRSIGIGRRLRDAGAVQHRHRDDRLAGRIRVHWRDRRLAAPGLHTRVHAHHSPRSIGGLGASDQAALRPHADRFSEPVSADLADRRPRDV